MLKRTMLSKSLLIAFSGTAALAGGAAFAQQADQAPVTLQRVEITGSSIKRIEGETALPVQVLTRDDIQKTGAANVEQLLQTVSAVSSSGGNTASSASGATTGGISSVSLRGLTSLRTLVLINGRRLAPYGIGFTNDSVSVDVNSIPIAAIERVEILKDGASAVYGSDAIAGVINFILRKDYKGLEMSAEYGDTSQGGGGTKRVSGTWGVGDLSTDRFNFMLVGSYQKEDALFGRDRRFANSSFNVANQNDTTSGNTFPANIAAVDGSFGTRNPSRPTGCLLPYSTTADPFLSPKGCRFDPAPLVTLLPASERASVFASARFQLTDDLEAFAEASFNRNTQRTVIQPVPLSDQFTMPLNNPLAKTAPYNQYTTFPSSTVILTTASPFYPTAYVQGITGGATPDLFVRYRAAVNGNRDFTDISEAPRLTFGVRGLVGGWDVDSAFLYSSSKVREQVNDGYPILSKILPLLNSGTVNFFGPNSAAIDSQIQATNFSGNAYSVTSSLTSVSAKASRDVMQLPAGALALAVGAEARREKYLFEPSTQISQGDISGYGGNLAFTDKSRNVGSVFAEINVPIVKGLEADAAVRYDNYQGTGSSTTPKLSLRWQPVSSVLVRGSVGQGFRAPSLADLYSPATTGVSQTGLSDPLRCPTTNDGVKDCGTQFPTTNGGKLGLKSEKSNNVTLGFVFEPTNNVSVGIDAFKITLKDTISNGLPQAVILGDLAKYGSYVTRGPVDPAFPALPGPIINIDQTNLNTGETRLAGFDVDFKWRIPAADFGHFTVGFNGTYFSKYDTENPDGTFTGNVANLNNATTGGIIPRVKTYQSVNWARGPWDVTVAMNWQSGYIDTPGTVDPAGLTREVGTYETYDMQTTYSGLKNLRLTLGIKNILNRDPPYTNQTFSFQSGYDPQYADPRGRFLYARLNYAFK